MVHFLSKTEHSIRVTGQLILPANAAADPVHGALPGLCARRPKSAALSEGEH